VRLHQFVCGVLADIVNRRPVPRHLTALFERAALPLLRHASGLLARRRRPRILVRLCASLQFAQIREIMGSTNISNAFATPDAGTCVVSDFTCFEFSRGMATPVPLILISSIAQSDESQK
jgi:hypothetical protein